MAHPATDLHYPPSYSIRFTTYPRTLAGSPNVDAPAKVYHMPCQVIIEAGAGGIFNYTDNAGVANALTFAAAGTYGPYRMAPHTINASTVTAVTVFWEAPLTSL